MGRTGYTCVRQTLCCYNLMFWIFGCGLLGVGIWLRLAYDGYAGFVTANRALSADGLCITAGVITFLIGFLGCCGAWFQSRCMLITYFVLVILIFLLEFTAGTLGFVYRKQVGETLKNEMQGGIKQKYAPDNRNGLVEVWDHIHTKFHCCGVLSYEDWHNIAAWPGKKWVPTSCCQEEFKDDPECGKSNDVELIYRGGCYQKIHLWIMKRLYIVGIICMTFAFVQLFGLIAAMVMLCTASEKRKKKQARLVEPWVYNF